MPRNTVIIVLVLLFVFFGLAMKLLPILPSYIANNELFLNTIFVLIFFTLITGFVWVMKNARR